MSDRAAWRVARDAWRTLATHPREAITIAALPTLLILLGDAVLSATLLGSPFPGLDDYPEPLGPLMAVTIPEITLYAAGTLLIFVSWVRLLVAGQPPRWWSLGPHETRVAPIWFATWMVVPLLLGLAAFLVLFPLVLVFVFVADGAMPAWEGGASIWTKIGVVGLVWLPIAFASAPWFLRAALIAAGVPKQSPAWRAIVPLWPRAGMSFALATTPLLILTFPLDGNIDAFNWMPATVGVVSGAATTLLQGAIFAQFIRDAGAAASGSVNA